MWNWKWKNPWKQRCSALFCQATEGILGLFWMFNNWRSHNNQLNICLTDVGRHPLKLDNMAGSVLRSLNRGDAPKWWLLLLCVGDCAIATNLFEIMLDLNGDFNALSLCITISWYCVLYHFQSKCASSKSFSVDIALPIPVPAAAVSTWTLDTVSFFVAVSIVSTTGRGAFPQVLPNPFTFRRGDSYESMQS